MLIHLTTNGNRPGHDMNGFGNRMCLFFNGGCYDRLKAVAEKHGLKYTV